jgi:arginine decarboxylase
MSSFGFPKDAADFIAGRVLAAMERYRESLLPPYTRALVEYSQVREHSWSAPGHQGGVGFTKLPIGRAFHDFYGENLFRTDMGIERGQLGSLLDHTGPVAESEQYAARVLRSAPQLLRRRRHVGVPIAPSCRHA